MSDDKHEVANALIEAARILKRSEEEIRRAEVAEHVQRAFRYAGANEDELTVLAKQKHNFDRGGEYHHFHEHVLDVLRGKLVFVEVSTLKDLQEKRSRLNDIEINRKLTTQDGREITVEEFFSPRDRDRGGMLGILTRIRNGCANQEIRTLRQLVSKTEHKLSLCFLGHRSIQIIRERLFERDLYLGMYVPEL